MHGHVCCCAIFQLCQPSSHFLHTAPRMYGVCDWRVEIVVQCRAKEYNHTNNNTEHFFCTYMMYMRQSGVHMHENHFWFLEVSKYLFFCISCLSYFMVLYLEDSCICRQCNGYRWTGLIALVSKCRVTKKCNL